MEAVTDTWKDLGPGNITVWTLALDPTDPETIYAGNSLGVYKSSDGAKNWTRLKLADSSALALAIDPSNSSTIYAGIFQGGVFKTTDRGATWVAVNSGLLASTAWSLLIDPTNSNTIYAGTDRGVFKSSNYGMAWTERSTGLPSDTKFPALAVDPRDHQVLFAGSAGRGLFKSTDGGNHWSIVNSVPAFDIQTIVFDPSSPGTIYLGEYYAGVWKSVDGGINWSAANGGLATAGPFIDVQALLVDPANPNNLYLGTPFHGIFRSSDAGGHWTPANSGLTEVASVHALAVDPNRAETVYAGVAQMGVYVSTNRGDSWAPKNRGMVTYNNIYAVATDPLNPDKLYIGSEFGAYATEDGGISWTSINDGLKFDNGYTDIYALGVNPVRPGVLYAGTAYGVYKSLDGGKHWTNRSLSFNRFFALAIDPSNPEIVYAASTAVFKSPDGGITWNDVGIANGALALAIDASNPSQVYAGTATGVLRSVDGGASWIKQFSDASAVTVLAIDPLSPRTLYAVTGNGLYRTQNGGGTWSLLDLGFPSGPVRAVVIDPANPKTLYVGTKTLGVVRSVDGGNTWTRLNDGLRSLNILSLAVPPADHRVVFAGTASRTEQPGSVIIAGLFSLNTESAVPSLTLTSPNGTEEWFVGSTHPITWRTTGSVGNIQIEYSTDGGKTFLLVAQSVPNSGSFTWTVPDLISSRCRVRIRSEAISDVSNGNFAILRGCQYSIRPAAQLYDVNGGAGNVDVSAPPECSWTAVSNAEWIAVESGSRGTGDGTVAYRVLANENASFRMGTLSIAGQTFTVTQTSTSRDDAVTLLVPIVLSANGLNGSFFTSEITVANRSTADAVVEFTYKGAADLGGGGGVASFALPSGRQQVMPDAIEYLKSLGIEMPSSGNRGGTLRVRFFGISNRSEAVVLVRTTTKVPKGQAGLAYSAVLPFLDGTNELFIHGLRQNSKDRANVAIQNLGEAQDGEITLNVYGSANLCRPDYLIQQVVLPPGGFKQFSGVLGLLPGSVEEGCVIVSLNYGRAPFYAYGVINDQSNSDGSFVPPISEGERSVSRLILPAIVETNGFTSELILTDLVGYSEGATLQFVADSVQRQDHTVTVTIPLGAFEQKIIPDFIQYLRQQGATDIGPLGGSYVGPLFVTTRYPERGGGLAVAARTSRPDEDDNGEYGVFYPGVPAGSLSTTNVWLFGLQQNAQNRSNLALVNSGEVNDDQDQFAIDLYDGNSGERVNTINGIALAAKRWTQFDAILAKYAPGTTQGYARIRRISGSNPFIAYAVINDGGKAGERTGDGAYISSIPEE